MHWGFSTTSNLRLEGTHHPTWDWNFPTTTLEIGITHPWEKLPTGWTTTPPPTHLQRGMHVRCAPDTLDARCAPWWKHPQGPAVIWTCGVPSEYPTWPEETGSNVARKDGFQSFNYLEVIEYILYNCVYLYMYVYMYFVYIWIYMYYFFLLYQYMSKMGRICVFLVDATYAHHKTSWGSMFLATSRLSEQCTILEGQLWLGMLITNDHSVSTWMFPEVPIAENIYV